MQNKQEKIYNKDYFNQRIGVFDKNRKIEERKRFNVLKQYVSSKGLIKILDAGCGMGYFLAFCDKEGWQTFGIDVSGYALAKASTYTKAELKQVNLNNSQLPFEDSFFDIIIAIDSIEHLESGELFLQETRRTLKKDGIFFLLTPDGHSVYDDEPNHINIYKKENLVNKLKAYDFKILDIKESRGYTERIVPLRRYPFINKINQKLCDFFGMYVKEIIIIARK